MPPAAEPPAPRRFVGVGREALSGRQHDYTTTPLRRAIVLLAIPMMLEMAMESVFAVCDIFFVARIGPDRPSWA